MSKDDEDLESKGNSNSARINVITINSYNVYLYLIILFIRNQWSPRGGSSITTVQENVVIFGGLYIIIDYRILSN